MKMQTFRKPHQWLTFWLEKYLEVLANLKFDGDTRKQYWAILKSFLEAHPGNPRNLSLADVHSFISEAPEMRLVPVTLFFQHIAPSKPHLEMLKKFGSSAGKVPEEESTSNEPLEKFITTLQDQGLSERTVKNYSNAVSGYFKWAEENEKPADKPHIEGYVEFLSTIRQLAPRTIAMHQTALRLFYGIDEDKQPDKKH